MTTSPVAMPIRTCSGPPLTAVALTPAATARPARSANRPAGAPDRGYAEQRRPCAIGPHPRRTGGGPAKRAARHAGLSAAHRRAGDPERPRAAGHRGGQSCNHRVADGATQGVIKGLIDKCPLGGSLLGPAGMSLPGIVYPLAGASHRERAPVLRRPFRVTGKRQASFTQTHHV
jgi:hypothetical protein